MSRRKKKKKKLDKSYEVESVTTCPRCNNKSLQRRVRSKMQPLEWNKEFVYLEWDFCPRCKYLQHYNDMKISMNEAIDIFKQDSLKEIEERI